MIPSLQVYRPRAIFTIAASLSEGPHAPPLRHWLHDYPSLLATFFTPARTASSEIASTRSPAPRRRSAPHPAASAVIPLRGPVIQHGVDQRQPDLARDPPKPLERMVRLVRRRRRHRIEPGRPEHC